MIIKNYRGSEFANYSSPNTSNTWHYFLPDSTVLYFVSGSTRVKQIEGIIKGTIQDATQDTTQNADEANLYHISFINKYMNRANKMQSANVSDADRVI